MSIQKLLRSFRANLGVGPGEDFTLEDEVALYKRRADVALREERYNDALVFLAKILRLNPYDLQARMLVAQIYHHGLLEPTKALLTYEKIVASAGYDESNSYCVIARDGIRELTAAFEAAAHPLQDLLADGADEILSQEDLVPETVAG
ncbi:MAG: hypothetical protein ABIT01_20040 [Thermoanaerobaculia bacterium]